MSSANFPAELLLLIFETVAEFNRSYVDAESLQIAYERNATLCACALVCKAWSGPAQKVLFYDISLGVVADPGNEEIDEFNPRARPGRTAPALSSLISTLITFESVSNPIRLGVRAMHLCLGHTDSVSFNTSLSIDHVIHSSPEDVIRAVTLCPNLVHLSILIGVLPTDTDTDHPVVFSSLSLNLLRSAELQHLRHLSLSSAYDEDFVYANDYFWPTAKAAYQLLEILGHTITSLDINISSDYETDDDDLMKMVPLLLPALRTLHCRLTTTNLDSAVCARAPSLRRVVTSLYDDAAPLENALPLCIEDLTVEYVGTDCEISAFDQLKKFTLREWRSDDLVPLLMLSLPPSVEHLEFPAEGAVDEVAEKTAEILRRLPNLRSLTLVQHPYAPVLVRQDVFHMPVRIISEIPNDRVFSCVN